MLLNLIKPGLRVLEQQSPCNVVVPVPQCLPTDSRDVTGPRQHIASDIGDSALGLARLGSPFKTAPLSRGRSVARQPRQSHVPPPLPPARRRRLPSGRPGARGLLGGDDLRHSLHLRQPRVHLGHPRVRLGHQHLRGQHPWHAARHHHHRRRRERHDHGGGEYHGLPGERYVHDPQPELRDLVGRLVGGEFGTPGRRCHELDLPATEHL